MAPDAVNVVVRPLQMDNETGFAVTVGKGLTVTTAVSVAVHPLEAPVTV